MNIINLFVTKIIIKKKSNRNMCQHPLVDIFLVVNHVWTEVDLLLPIKKWLDELEVRDSTMAHRICKFIPSQCPFSREIKFFDRKIVTIPPLCKLNPLYQNLIGLKFRSMVYLADICGEDISIYC